MNERLALALLAPAILGGVLLVHWLELLIRYVWRKLRSTKTMGR